MIKVKLFKLVNSMGTLKVPGALECLVMCDLGGKTSHDVIKVVRAVKSEIEAYTETNNGLIKKFGEKVKGIKGQAESYKVEQDSKNFPEYFKEIQEVGQKDIELKDFEMIDINKVLTNPKGQENIIKPIHIEILDWLLKE